MDGQWPPGDGRMCLHRLAVRSTVFTIIWTVVTKIRWSGLNRLLTCGGYGQNFTPVARPTDVHGSHRDEVTASSLQLNCTLAGGHTYYRSEGLTSGIKLTSLPVKHYEKALFCTISDIFGEKKLCRSFRLIAWLRSQKPASSLAEDAAGAEAKNRFNRTACLDSAAQTPWDWKSLQRSQTCRRSYSVTSLDALAALCSLSSTV